MRLLISGASGLVGGALVPHLRARGHDVVRLVRRAPRGPDEAEWNPDAGTLDPAHLEGVDAVVNLAGENIADKRWTAARKAALKNSRILSTRTLGRAVAACAHPPGVFISGC